MNSQPLLPAGLHFFERGWLSSNNILLVDDSQTVLIDSGYWTHADQTLTLIDSVLQGRPLQRLLNTHLHSDHCGGNAKLQERYPHLETWVPSGSAAHVFDWDPAAFNHTTTGQHCPVFKAQRIIHPGDVFEVAGIQWQAYAAPGHDPDSLIFFSPSHRILISADALWENGFGVVFPEIERIDAFDVVAQTLDLIESLQPQMVLPGHGATFTDVHGAISRARSRLKSFIDSPQKHAAYAGKVLLKFKLLELQRVNLPSFMAWAQDCELLHTLHDNYAPQTDWKVWLDEMIHGLVAAHAATLDGEDICNL
jgi:glyoxylase-like metal-dependent hydrolase (beta-lactamase superfamily II)